MVLIFGVSLVADGCASVAVRLRLVSANRPFIVDGSRSRVTPNFVRCGCLVDRLFDYWAHLAGWAVVRGPFFPDATV